MIHLRGQEFGVILSCNLSCEVLGSQLDLVALWCLLFHIFHDALQQAQNIRLVDLLALTCRDAVLGPLPHLASAHFGSSSVLHKAVNWHTTNTTYPSFHVSKTNFKIILDALLGDDTSNIHVEQVIGRDFDFIAAN